MTRPKDSAEENSLSQKKNKPTKRSNTLAIYSIFTTEQLNS